MQIYCRYLLHNFFKVFLLSVASFVAILLLISLTDVAEFSTLGAPISKLLLFTSYQIPYVLPLAIPIGALLASFLFFQRLTSNLEIVALQVGGFSIYKVFAPLLTAALFLTIGSFYITSEVATTSHLKTRKMIYDLTSINPLLLLQNAKVAKLKGAYTEMDSVQNGHKARNLVIALPGKSMALFLAKEVEVHEDALLGTNLSLLTTHEGNLAIENVEKARSAAPDLAQLIRTKGWKISHDHLNWRLLQARKRHLLKQGTPKAAKSLVKIKTEIIRRASLALTAFTFVFMGGVFGMRRKVLVIVGLAAATLIAFSVGKELDHLLWISAACYILPHLIILGASLYALKGDFR